MGLKGKVPTLRKFTRNLKKIPVTLAHRVAKDAEPVLTRDTQKAFDSGKTVYGAARPASTVTGEGLTLVRTGTTRNLLRFVANGRQLRAVLSPRYAKFLIGKYNILPNGPIPPLWLRQLAKITKVGAL